MPPRRNPPVHKHGLDAERPSDSTRVLPAGAAKARQYVGRRVVALQGEFYTRKVYLAAIKPHRFDVASTVSPKKVICYAKRYAECLKF